MIEKQKQNNQKQLKFRTFIKMVNISFCSPGKELLTFYLKGIEAIIGKTQKQTDLVFNMMSIQIDNQSEMDPVYPVLLKPTDLRAVIEQPDAARALEEEQVIVPEDVFQLKVSMRHDFPNVIYFSQIAFLMQRLDIKMELAHLMLLYQFFRKTSKIFNKNLVTQHKIFQNFTEIPPAFADTSQEQISQQRQPNNSNDSNLPEAQPLNNEYDDEEDKFIHLERQDVDLNQAEREQSAFDEQFIDTTTQR